jgi:hypothetical protein
MRAQSRQLLDGRRTEGERITLKFLQHANDPFAGRSQSN